MIDPASIVIVRWPRGYVAHVRFTDSSKDIDLSSYNKFYLYEMVEKYVGAKS